MAFCRLLGCPSRSLEFPGQSKWLSAAHLGKDALSKGLGGINPSVAFQTALGKGLGCLNPLTASGLPPLNHRARQTQKFQFFKHGG